ncbi:MAG: GAF domain-containing protein [Endomicrobia bacterium]|nr:GAF domain-containing protein [Endomicrobiia bacterium]MDW8056189.1 GAF domain-containing protein [Elusimicrobiota bacterium]
MKKQRTKSKKLLKEIQTLSLISSTIVSSKFLDDILSQIVKLTADMFGSKICSIMLLDEKKEELIIKATQSLSEKYKNKPPVKIGSSISGLAVKERRPIFVLDVKKDPRYMFPSIAEEEGLCSMLAVPMVVKDKIIGVLNIYTATEYEFSQEEIDVLQTIANQAALAIENARLFEELIITKDTLETKKLVDRAKALLIKHRNFTEEEAHRFLQKKSMDLRKPVKEIAQAIILTFEEKK